ncbi:MAG: DUF47 domain-containing protein [Magnetococcales bacterium]|nr:DUF47 domain-containing protein [Magnetococcales bacterium]
MGGSNSFISGITNAVFPRMPNFYGMLLEQCDLVSQAMDALVDFMQTGSKAAADKVMRLENEEDALKARNLDVLANAFATPLDREDLQRAMTSVGVTMTYASTVVQEMQALNIKSGQFTTEMAVLLREANSALHRGYKKLGTKDTALGEADAQVAVQAKHTLDRAFRRALAELFNADKIMDSLKKDMPDAKMEAMGYVLEIFKRREIYRHLSDAGHELSRAGNFLHDIVVKIS